MTKLGLIDTGEVVHDTKNLSFPEMLETALLGGVKIHAVSYCDSATKYPEDKEGIPEDKEGIDKERRRVEKDRFQRTWNFFNLYGTNQWQQMIELKDLTALLIAMDDGVCDTRMQIIKAALEKQISILIKPPLAYTIERAKEIQQLAEDYNYNENISLWCPLRFARGVMDAHDIIQGRNQYRRFGPISSCSMNFATVSYPKFLTVVSDHIDLITYLVGDFEEITIRSTGTEKNPVFSLNALHTNGALGSYLFSSQRFLQQRPHCTVEILSQQHQLLVIDDAGLRRCSYYTSDKEQAHIPGFSHDTSSLEGSIRLLDTWCEKVNLSGGNTDAKNVHDLPTPQDARKTMDVRELLRQESEKLNQSRNPKTDYRRTEDGYKKV